MLLYLLNIKFVFGSCVTAAEIEYGKGDLVGKSRKVP